MKSLDKQITALHQALVNWSGKRPQWWGEQCGWLYMVFSAMRFIFAPPWESNAPMWLSAMALIGAPLLSVLLIASARQEWWWNAGKSESPAFRFLFLGLSVCGIISSIANGEMRGIVPLLVLTAYQYFNQCEDPPPPKPRMRASLAGGH